VKTDSKLALGTLLFYAIAAAGSGCAEEKATVFNDAALPSTTDSGARPSDASRPRSDGASSPGQEQTVLPYVTAAGIGVSDLEASARFYTEVLGLTFKYDLSTPNWDEKILEDVRGNSVVLMKSKPERKTQKNPVKLVFAVQDTEAAFQAVLEGGGGMASAPATFEGTTIALGYDPDEYLVELVQVPAVPSNVLVGMGIGVSDLDEAADYYTRVLGMVFERDIDVPGFMDEKVLRSSLMKGPSLVLMHYEDETKVYKDVPAKVVLGVPDAKAFASVIASEDAKKLLLPPAPYANSGLIVGMAKDLDGYLVEIIQSDPAADAGVGAKLDAGSSKDAGSAKDAGNTKDAAP